MGAFSKYEGRLGSVDVNIPGAITESVTGIAAGLTAAGAIAAGASFGTVVPIVGTAIGAIIGLAMNFLHAGYNPRKLNDTAVTEAVQIALHQTWYQLTGEDLGGVANPCVPGQCGAQHVAIFTESSYPNVPLGAAGNPDADWGALLPQVEQLIAQGRSRLVRPESYYDYDANTNYLLGLFQQVQQARAAAASSAVASAGSILTDLGLPTDTLSNLPWWALPAAVIGGLYLIS